MGSIFTKAKDFLSSILGQESDVAVKINKEDIAQLNASPEKQEKELSTENNSYKLVWEPHEIALLIYFLEKVYSNKLERKNAIKELSCKLRELGWEKLHHIDATYRNEAGISLQMSKMEYLLTKGKKGLAGAGKNFEDMYGVYINELDTFDKVLGVQSMGIFRQQNACSDKEKMDAGIKQRDIDWSSFDNLVNSYLEHYDEKSKQLSSLEDHVENKTEHVFSEVCSELNDERKILSLQQNNHRWRVTKKKIVGYELDGVYKDVNCWSSFYISIFNRLIQNYKQIHSFPTSIVVDSAPGVLKGRYAKLINGLFLFVNYSAKATVFRVKELLYCYGIASSKCTIYLEKDGHPMEKLNLAITDDAYSVSAVSDVAIAQPDEATKNILNIKKVLLEKYVNGFRLNSPLELERFKIFYKVINEEDFPNEISNDNLSLTIKKLGIQYEDKLYLPENMLDEDVKNSILKYIEACFISGQKIIYYSAIFDMFSNDFLNQNIFNREILKEYLSYVNSGNYYIYKDYIALERNATIDVFSEIVRAMSEKAGAFTPEELFDKLPYIPQNKIMQELHLSSDFISNGRGQYFLISQFSVTDSELQEIKNIISIMLSNSATSFITAGEIIDVMKRKMPTFIENNELISELGIRNAISRLLKDDFSFKANIISSKDIGTNMENVFIDFVLANEKFTLSELKNLARSCHSTIYFDVISQYAVRIDKNNFVSKNSIEFDAQSIDNAISCLLSNNDYMSIQEINYVSFPDIKMLWNNFLLESYLIQSSQKFSLMRSGFCETKTVGAIVKKNSAFSTFEDIIVDVLARSKTILDKDDALNYLCENGYLARRTLNSIDRVLEKAQIKRNMKG